MLLYHFVLKLLKQQVKNMIISSNWGQAFTSSTKTDHTGLPNHYF